MPVRVKKIGRKWRIVDAESGRVERFKKSPRKGEAVDGGGYDSKEGAIKKMQAINLSQLRKQGRRDVPPPPE